MHSLAINRAYFMGTEKRQSGESPVRDSQPTEGEAGPCPPLKQTTGLNMSRTYSTNGPTCPYCGRMFTPDEGFYYDAARYREQDCDECGKTFSVEVHHSTAWTCVRIDQLEQS